MNVLVTGAAGFVGRNLVSSLRNLQENKDYTRTGLVIEKIYEYDVNTNPELLDEFCKDAGFVFNLAGVNRPRNQKEFMEGNLGFAAILLDTLKKYKNRCPVMLASSVQATLTGRYADSDYGKSKLAGEELFFKYGKETGAKILVYRFPNLFGKWCRPNYNSVVATFCNNIANDLPIQVNDSSTELELVYIDDLITELIDALEGKEHCYNCNNLDDVVKEIDADNRCFCYVPIIHKVTLGKIVELLEIFKRQPQSLMMTEIPCHSFTKKLYSTYLSYLPESKIKYKLKMNCDDRGSFTEILKTYNCGQFSVNISKPGIIKGQHWHHSKWEFFIVVSGHGLIQERKIGVDEDGKSYPVMNFEVSGDKMEVVHMIPGCVHNIINLSKTENLVTVMWANEPFDNQRPDTYFELVE